MIKRAGGLSLTQRLVAMTAVALVPAAAALLSLISTIHFDREREVHDLALRTGQLANLEVERILAGTESTLKALAKAPAVRSFSRESCNRYLADVAAELPQLNGFTVADADGLVRCATDMNAKPERIDHRSYFAEAIESGGFVVGQFTPSRLGGAAYLPLALPMVEGGAVTGAVVTGIDLGWLDDRIREREYPPGSAMAIADRHGVILARQPNPDDFVGTQIPDAFQPFVQAERPGTTEVVSQDGTRRVVGYYPPKATAYGLYVSTALSTEQAFAPIYASTYRSLALAGVGALAAFALTWVVGDRLIRRPIRRLNDTIAAWRRGDTGARTGIPPSGSEISVLAAAIDEYRDELVVDRAARRRAERHRALLLREMEHRIKNILATVQAIARQTFRDAAAQPSLESFTRRLAAMGETHRMLLSDNWESADLRATLEAAVRPFAPERERRVSMQGPPLRIRARAALGLGMAVHELCTNAAKYGALSTDDGTVTIAWALRPGDDGDRFVFSWREMNGPPVVPPERTGFGSRMIEAALGGEFDAEVALRYPPEGVVFTVEAEARLILACAGPEREVEAAE